MGCGERIHMREIHTANGWHSMVRIPFTIVPKSAMTILRLRLNRLPNLQNQTPHRRRALKLRFYQNPHSSHRRNPIWRGP